MFDYYGAINSAKVLSNQASNLRNQISNLNELIGIVGGAYSGPDAQAYKIAVEKAKQELNDIAGKLDKISANVRAAADEVKREEEAQEESKSVLI